MEMMKAVRIHQWGGADVLTYEDTPCPEPASGEVLVKIHAAGINPVDWQTRSGKGMSYKYVDMFPLILGWDISGVVEAVGSVASRFKPGDEVFGMVRFPDVGSAYAEYAAVPEQDLALKPRNVDHLHAAAIPLAALTAWQAFFEAGTLTSGDRLLIQGAAGGVGHMAVQIAKWKGAYVVGSASTGNLDFIRSLNVDEIVDYTLARVEDVVSPLDMVFDTVGGDLLNRSLDVVKEHGSLVTIAGRPDEQKANERHIKAGGILVHPSQDHLSQLADLMAAGHLHATIAQVFPLAETQAAHKAFENRTVRRGKVVLQVVTG